jgi:hypothetical protein
MLQRKHKIIALLVVVALCLSLLTPINANAASTGKTIRITHNIDIAEFASNFSSTGILGTCDTDIGIDDSVESTYTISNYWGSIAAEHKLLRIEIYSIDDANKKCSIDVPQTKPTSTVREQFSKYGFGYSGVAGVTGISFMKAGSVTVIIEQGVTNVNDSIVVEFVWQTDDSDNGPKYDVQIIGSGNGSAEYIFITNSENSSIYTLTVTPNIGYMLDYWEYSTDGGSNYQDSKRIYNTPANDKATITETITENRVYRAVFKTGQVALLGGSADVFPIAQLPNDYFDRDYLKDVWIAPGISLKKETMREGSDALLGFYYAVPSKLTNVIGVGGKVTFDFYKGDYRGKTLDEQDRFWEGWYAPNSFDTFFNREISKMYVLARVRHIPYMEGFTIVTTINKGEVNAGEPLAQYYTIPEGYLIADPLLSARENAIAELGEKITDCNADRPAYHRIRYLMLGAYESALTEISAAENADALASAKEAALAKFALYESYKDGDPVELTPLGDLPGVYKIAVSVTQKPVFAYVPNDFSKLGKGAYALGVLCAALENDFPGNWFILNHGTLESAFITDIIAGGDHATGEIMDSGSTVSGIVYAIDNIWAALGISQQHTQDRGVVRVGGVSPAGIPNLGDSLTPNKDDLIWAIAELREIYTDEQLATVGTLTAEQISAYNNALDLVVGLYETATIYQSVVDNAYEALKTAFPNDNLTHNDLPQPVLDVMARISAIGNITPDSGEAIAAAREAYNALTTENQALVPNYTTLTAAEEAFARLSAATSEYSSALRDVAVENLIKQNLTVSSIGGEWALLAAVRSGEAVPGSAFTNSYLSSLNKLLNDGGLDGVTTTNYTDFARITLALSSLGMDASSYSAAGKTYDIVGQLTNYNKVVSQGINGAVFTLIALDSKPYLPENTALRGQYVSYILGEEIEGGGWALSGTRPDPDITAMVLQALAKYRGDTTVDAAVARGVAVLKDLQDATHGGFHSWGQYNSESAAQTIVALIALGIDPAGEDWTVSGSKNPLTALMTFYDASSHGFRHALNGGVDSMATEQAACALAAYDRFVNEENALYDMSDAFGGSSAQVNKNELNAAISLAKSLTGEDYTPETWGALQTALGAAQSVSADAEATQTDVNGARAALLAAIGNLITAELSEPGSNTERLTSALAIAPKLTLSDYTAGTWGALQSAQATAQSVNPSDQAAVDTAAEALLAALAALELKDIIDTALLAAAVSANKTALVQADYTSETWLAYTAALTTAQTEQASPTTQMNADFAAQSLIAAIGGLTKASGEDYTAVTGVLTAIKTAVVTDARYTDTSLTALDSATEKAALVGALCQLTLKPTPLNNALLDAAVEAGAGLTANKYTTETWESLSLALVSTQLKKMQGIYTAQSEVDADARSILEAAGALAPEENTGGANKTLLNLYITQAELLNGQSYSAASWQTLQTALTAARTITDAAGAAQSEVDAARKALVDAIAALVKLADKTALNAAIAQAQAIMNKGYTNDSWKYLTDALTAAKLVRDTETAAQTAIDAAASDLRLAIDGLEYPEAPPSTGPTPGAPTITVTFRLIGATLSNRLDESDELSASIDLGDEHGYKGSEYKTWIATRSYVLNEGATVYDLFMQAITGAGLSQVGADKNYVKTITAPAYYGGYALSEFTNGRRSGWMYTINGTHPGYGLIERQLANGDAVIWHYANDYAYEVADWFGDETEYPSLATNAIFYNKWLAAEDVNPPRDGNYAPPATQDSDGDTTGGAETAPSNSAGVNIVATETVTAETKTENGKATATVDTKTVTDAVTRAKDAVGTAKSSGDADAKAEVKIVAKTEPDSGAAESAKSAEVAIPSAAIKAIAEAKDIILTVESSVSTITLDTEAVAAIADAANSGDTVTLTAENVDSAEALNAKQQARVGGNQVVELNISVGAKTITTLGGIVTVSVPYAPETDLDSDDYDLLTVYHLDGDGNITEMKGATYDAKTGAITFATNRFSKFFVAEWISPFGDISKGEWYYKAARHAYSNGLITGVTDTTFAPQATLTRAMLITILARQAGVDTAGGETWYSKAVEWGVASGITDGDNMNGEITREQFATLLYRYAKAIDNEQPTIDNPGYDGYADAGDISDWASDAMAWAVANGLVTGRTATTLAPQGTATRAEAAALLQRYITDIR